MNFSINKFSVLLISNMFLSIKTFEIMRLMIFVFFALREIKDKKSNIEIDDNCIWKNGLPFYKDIYDEYIEFNNKSIPQKNYRKYNEFNEIYMIVNNVFNNFNKFSNEELVSMIKK